MVPEVEDSSMSERLKKAVENVRILTAALNEIRDPLLWTKGQLFDSYDKHFYCLPNSPVCAIGAVMKAMHLCEGQYSNLPANALNALKALAKVTTYENPDDIDWVFVAPHIYTFNDANDTTHEQIVSAYETAIKHECETVRFEVAQESMNFNEK